MERIYAAKRRPTQRTLDIQKHELRALRENQSNSKSPNLLIQAFQGINSFLSTATYLLLPNKPNRSMCKYYGHVIARSWTGAVPKCEECGAKVNSSEQLRKSNMAGNK